MILKGLKEKSIKKSLNSILNNRETDFNTNKIESMGIILNADETTDLESIKTIAQSIHVRPNKLKIIAFTESKKKSPILGIPVLIQKILPNGKINNVELQSFLDTKFDVLISYYSKDVLEIKYLMTASKAHFKIGIFQLDKRFNDLIIKTDFNNIEAFKTELIKYLSVLNKLNT